MRPLPRLPVETELPVHLSLCLIRGNPCPVLNLSRILGSEEEPRRLVLVCLPDQRKVALAVGSVERVSRLPQRVMQDKPPLLEGAARQVVEALATLDRELLCVLDGAALLTDDEWSLVGAP